MNTRLQAIIEADQRLERLARRYVLAGLPLPAPQGVFADAALQAGRMRAELALEGYRTMARTDALLMMGQAYMRARGIGTCDRAAHPRLLAWMGLP